MLRIMQPKRHDANKLARRGALATGAGARGAGESALLIGFFDQTSRRREKTLDIRDFNALTAASLSSARARMRGERVFQLVRQ
jgi:hypothetical protein